MAVKKKITKAATAAYIKEKIGELEGIQKRYETCLAQILYQQEFLDTRWDLNLAHRHQETRITALTDKHNIPFAPEVLASHIQSTTEEVAAAHKQLDKIQSYVNRYAARDQKLIKTAVARAATLHKNFRKTWEPAATAALTQKNWAHATAAVLNIPDYEDFVRIPCQGKKLHSTASEKLERLLYDITRWAETTQAQIPPAAFRRGEIKFAEAQARQLRKKLVTAVSKFDAWLEKSTPGSNDDNKELNKRFKAISLINTTRCGWLRRAKTLRVEQEKDGAVLDMGR